MSTSSSISQGMGTGPSFTLPLPTIVLTVTNNWVATWFLLLFYQEVARKTPAFVFRNSLISTHAQHHRVSAESAPKGLIWCLLNLYSQTGVKINEALLEEAMNRAHISLSLDTRFGQRTNELCKAEMLLRRATLITKSKLSPCGASQNQSFVWRNTPCFSKTVAKGVSQV